MREPGNPHMLFNPDSTGLHVANVPRGDWPATLRHRQRGEVFDYQETIIDRQGAFESGRDYYYRRFDAFRSGAGRR